MAKLDNYSGSLKVPSGFMPKNGDFALMEAHQIVVAITEDGAGNRAEIRLDDELEAIKAGCGGSGGGTASFETDETLTLKDGVLSVNVADSAAQDNALPISSSAVHTIVGNIEVLLNTI